MAAERDSLLEARNLIQQKRYDEARTLLKTIRHPKAQEWLAQLDARYPAAKSVPATPVQSPPAGNQPAQTNAKKNPGITLLRVIVGGVIAVLVAVPLMLLADNVLDIHPYFMSDPRRIFTATAAFTVVSTFAMCFIARLIGNTHHLLIGIYYILLAIILLAGWHFGSFYLQWGIDLPSPLSPETFTAYSNFVSTIPGDLMIPYGGSLLIAGAMAFFFGATSDEELLRRARENRR